MSTISVDYDVLNQKGSPAWFTDTFANIPTFGFVGRMFISTDTFAFYRDTGTGWDLIGGPGIGTLTGSGATGQVSFFNGTQVLTGNNNLFWDNTNGRLGINNSTPANSLDIIGTGKFTGVLTLGSTISNGTNSYTLPNATGTLALTSDLTTGYVPYTGATQSVALGLNNFSAQEININGNGTNNANLYLKQGIASLVIANGFSNILATGTKIGFQVATSSVAAYYADFQFSSLTGQRTYTLPNATGTIALTSDIPSNIVTGTGATGQVAYWSGTSTQAGNNNLFWDTTNNRLGINTIVPTAGVTSYSTTSATQFKAAGTSAGITFSDTVAAPTYSGAIGIATAVNNFVTGTAIGDMGIVNQSTTAGAIVFGIGSLNEKARISSSGNLLVGTATDGGFKLNVNGTINSSKSITARGQTDPTSGSGLELFYDTVSTSSYIQSYNRTGSAWLDILINSKIAVFQNNGTESMRISTAQNVSIGSTIDAGFRLFVKHPTGGIYVEAGTTSSHKALQCNTDGTGTILFFVRGDGLINTGLASFSPYNFSLSGRDCYINSSGELGYLSSTRESKTNINSVSDINWISQLNPVSFNYRKKDDEMNYTEEYYDDKSFGFIADEVEKVNPDFVFYDINEDGSKKLAGVKYQSMTAILTKIVQELNEKLIRNNIN